MGRGCERSITCLAPGCGYVYTHKRMATKSWQQEKLLHHASGECAKRVHDFTAREIAARETGGPGMTRKDVTEMVTEMIVPIYELLRKQGDFSEDNRRRIEKRLEYRKSRLEYKERDGKPAPWRMNHCVGDLRESFRKEQIKECVITKFRETMTKEYDPQWSWERALNTWFHWILDQSASDSVRLMAGDQVRFHEKKGPKQVTKLQFFRCFGAKVRKWDAADETTDSFFVGFWNPMVCACREMVHWSNHILFDLKCSNREKRELDRIVFPDDPYGIEPNLQHSLRVAQVFYDVLVARRAARREAKKDDEKVE